jgi:hypothetical protein
MATKVIRTDDLDGTPDASLYSFAINDEQFEIDLSEDNYKKLTEALAPFVEKGRKKVDRLPRERSASTAPRTSSDKERLAKVRAWAADNGIEVSSRGRIAKSVEDAYEKAVG